MKRNRYNLLKGTAILFVLLVSASISYGQTPFSEIGSEWKYLDDGTDQGKAWKELDFDDSKWAQGPGPLGYNEDQATLLDYGPDKDNKYITYYFRQTFYLQDAAKATNINTEFKVDDGMVMYINGHELLRIGLADSVSLDSVNYKTEFEDADEGTVWHGVTREEGALYNYSNPAAVSFLKDGKNVIAAEVHQSSPSSSDIRFYFNGTLDGDVSVVTGVEKLDSKLPTNYSLSRAYPNPFNPSTRINFSLPQTSAVKLEVFDAFGRLVETLADNTLPAGTYQYSWTANNLPSGIYVYRLTAGGFVSTNKMILMK